jgi:hypothetical protein
VEHQKRESAGIKTHDEIMELFEELKSLEEKIKNNDLLGKEGERNETIYREVETVQQLPIETVDDHHVIRPRGELLVEKKEKRKRLLSSLFERKEHQGEQKQKRPSFWGKEKISTLNPQTALDSQKDLRDITSIRSTFTLELDADGNLIGFPLKKQLPPTEKKGWFFLKRKDGAEPSGAEPAKGVKEKLLRLISRRTAKESSGGESQGGIGHILKRIFTRKSKE